MSDVKLIIARMFFMLKVVITDDEKIQLESLVEFIRWADFGMEVVGCASDGMKALDLIQKHCPDILITDVRMPRMSGLELSKKAKEILPEIKIIIISGYEEFEYARSAVDLNAYAYILKPIDIDSMEAELKKISSVCFQDITMKKEIAGIKEKLEESKPLLIDKFLKDMLNGLLNDETIIRQRTEYLGVRLPDSKYFAVLFQVEDSKLLNLNENEKQLFTMDFYNYIENICSSINYSIVIPLNEFEYVLILSINDECGSQDIITIVDHIREELGKRYLQKITIGVSNIKEGDTSFHEAYKEAEATSRQKFYLGKGKNIYYMDITLQGNNPILLEEMYNKLILHVEIGNIAVVEETLDYIFNAMSGSRSIDELDVKAFCYRMVGDIYRILYTLKENVSAIFGEEHILWQKIGRFDTIPDVWQWMKNIIIEVTRFIYTRQSGKNSNAVNTIREILDTRYIEHITIEDLAKKVFLTPNYISNIFKESVGDSVIDYLTKVRMKHAARLLSDPVLKIYEVAEAVGFANNSYFANVFKGMYGVTPKEYREKIKANEEQDSKSN